MKSDITVQAAGGGVRRTVSRSAGQSRWKRVKGHLREGGWSLLGFVSGLVLASLYGITTLFVQTQPLWFCVYVTLGVAVPAAFGMGLSAGIRANVTVMLPSLCSAHGRNFLLFLFVSVLLSGPVANTLENTERAAASLLCGAELAANQTQELMQKAAMPLSSALDRIREISSNAYSVAERVNNFIDTLTDSVRHVARTLRNVYHFLSDIGDICNAKLGSPYRKCRSVFGEARADCVRLLGDFDFLCDIVDGFLPLCNIARAGELFCIIPSYVADHLKKRLAAPVVAAFEQMKREFEFNLSTSATFDLDANSSSSVHQVSQDVMEEVSSDLQLFHTLSQPLKYGGLVLLAWSFLRAVQYRRRYCRERDFDNVYITSQFEEVDQQVTSGGGVSVLPLNRREAKTYITPLSLQLSSREWRAVLVGVASVLRYLVVGVLLVALDFLVFWVLDQVHHQLTEDVVARAPVTVAVLVNGSGFASDIFRDLVASFNVLQGGNVTVISRKCLLRPAEPNYSTCFILGFLLGLALLVSLSGGFVQRCRRLVCSSYHPETELERIQFLRQHILDQRRAEGGTLRKAVARSLADRGGGGGGGRGGGGGGGGGGSRLRTLLLRSPGGVRLSHLLGLSSAVTCLACGEEARSEEDNNMVACDVPRCTGLYCRTCFHSLGNTCVVCMRPLTFQEDGEEELDSSDDEQLSLWSAALDSPRITDPRARTLMRRRISTATSQAPAERSDVEVGVKDQDVDSELSEADMMYQTGSDESDSDASFYSTSSPKLARRQDEALVTVLIHRPDARQTLQDPPETSVSP
ncbi:DC-STAMP domain-containing protein 2 isoform X2 [Scophthalmus maximus]|uniref:DC-STAMP domain-containing protein 2 isoform X2 n=1 Tax=Scophthalmus maximus TaxID=52904 RepID=UPI001FA92397|nr:DC-STAMP domain-containing protein 2 isoform X2 [Scophthalmus maximus]